MKLPWLGLAIGALLLLGLSSRAQAMDLTAIAADPFTQANCAAVSATNHQSIVEPDSFANGATIVAVFQVGRIASSGACAIGFAASLDNGATWSTGILPGVTKYAGGIYDRVSDPAIAYDARHGVWLAASLAIMETASGTRGAAVIASRSTDGGLTWQAPVVIDSASLDSDKDWIVCDNSPVSPHYGNCYAEWDDHGVNNRLFMSTSADGGLTWGAARTNRASGIGGQPVVRRDGTVIVPVGKADLTSIGAFHSSNGGATWSAVKRIAVIRHHEAAGGLREEPMPSAEVDGVGTVYVAWADCRFRSLCRANDIVFVKSTNAIGTTWTRVRRVPIDSTTMNDDHFIPGLAVNAGDSGNAWIGLTFYLYRPATGVLGIGFISSLDGGRTWSAASQLTTAATEFPPRWAATTGPGRMLGDYISTSFAADGQAHGIVVLAASPTTGAGTGCTTSGLDNCNECVATFAAPVAGAAATVAGGPVLFTGQGDGRFAAARARPVRSR